MKIPLERVEETQREHLAQIVVRFIRGHVQPRAKMPPEIYSKAFDIALQLVLVYEAGSITPAFHAEVIEFAVELMERAQMHIQKEDEAGRRVTIAPSPWE